MKKSRILKTIVHRNIGLFQKIVKWNRHAQKSKDRKIYQLFVHCTTGNIRFSNPSDLKAHSWKKISMELDTKTKKMRVLENEKDAFSFKDLNAVALHVMVETLRLFESLLLLEEDSFSFANENDLIHSAWFSIEREKAEAMLEDKSVGSFFFRKGEYAKILESELSSNLNRPVKCFTLTYLDRNKIVREKIIVTYDHTWLFYNDDPALQSPSYSSFFKLLNTLSSSLKTPVLHEY